MAFDHLDVSETTADHYIFRIKVRKLTTLAPTTNVYVPCSYCHNLVSKRRQNLCQTNSVKSSAPKSPKLLNLFPLAAMYLYFRASTCSNTVLMLPQDTWQLLPPDIQGSGTETSKLWRCFNHCLRVVKFWVWIWWRLCHLQSVQVRVSWNCAGKTLRRRLPGACLPNKIWNVYERWN